MNIVILTGNLVDKPEIKTFKEDSKVAYGCLAVRRDFKKEETDFINLVAFNKLADYLDNYAHKGDKCEIVGHWQVRKWEDKDGKTRVENECVVEKIICYKKSLSRDEKAEKKEQAELDDADLPF